LSLEHKRGLISPSDPKISVRRQSELLGLSRSSYYYEPQPESEYNLELMHMIDEQYMRRPFYGSRRMRDWLRAQGHMVCRDRIRRLMRLMGTEAIYPRPRLSIKDKEHRIYPYLLREMEVVHAGF